MVLSHQCVRRHKMVTTGLRKPILLALLTQPLLEASSAEAGQRKWIFPQCQDALARPLHPLLWFLLVLLKGALQFAQEINIPNIISSQFRQPREQLGALQAGGGGEHVHFLELSWESSLQETPRNCSKQTKKLLGNLATGSPERPWYSFVKKQGASKHGIAGTGHPHQPPTSSRCQILCVHGNNWGWGAGARIVPWSR